MDPLELLARRIVAGKIKQSTRWFPFTWNLYLRLVSLASTGAISAIGATGAAGATGATRGCARTYNHMQFLGKCYM